MTREERRAWVGLVMAVLSYGAYVAVVLGGADGRPLPDVPYGAAMLWTIGVSIVVTIVVTILTEIVVGMVRRDTSLVVDERDREVGQLGDRVGQSFVAIGALAAMLMAIAEWDGFWIANVIYLCFVLSAIVGGLAKVIVYRKGLPAW